MIYPDVFLGILFSIRDFGVAEAQKDMIMIFEQLFSVICMYGCHGQRLFIKEKCK